MGKRIRRSRPGGGSGEEKEVSGKGEDVNSCLGRQEDYSNDDTNPDN